HAREALTHVLARQRVEILLQHARLARIVVQCARECGLEPGQVRTALVRVDVVDERERVLVVAVVVLERELDVGLLALCLDVDDLRVQRLARAAQELDELDDAALVVVDLGARRALALVGERDLEAAVQERELAQPVREGVEVEAQLREDLRVRLERDRKSTRLNSSHVKISYAVFCLKKKTWENSWK